MTTRSRGGVGEGDPITLVEMLQNPAAVRVNILRGTIKVPEDLVWLHDTNGPVAAIRAALDAALARAEAAERGLEIEVMLNGDLKLQNELAADQSDKDAVRIEALEAGLRVFTKHYQPWMDGHPDDTESGTFSRHTFGDLRRARALLNPEDER
jgi:hypothetical protein